MRKVLFALAATAAFTTPAFANEARIEARGGVAWIPGTSKGTAGIAAGYDFDLGKGAFAGVEVSGDKVLTTGTQVAFGFNGRLGAKLGDQAKLFAAGGYTTEICSGCKGTWDLGAGVNYDVAKSIYITGEYRHFFKNSTAYSGDALVAGLGFKF